MSSRYFDDRPDQRVTLDRIRALLPNWYLLYVDMAYWTILKWKAMLKIRPKGGNHLGKLPNNPLKSWRLTLQYVCNRNTTINMLGNVKGKHMSDVIWVPLSLLYHSLGNTSLWHYIWTAAPLLCMGLQQWQATIHFQHKQVFIPPAPGQALAGLKGGESAAEGKASTCDRGPSPD